MPKNISEMEKEIVKSALGMRVKLAARRGYREDDTRDAIDELMLSNPEMFDELRKAAGQRFKDNSEVALWLEGQMIKVKSKQESPATEHHEKTGSGSQ